MPANARCSSSSPVRQRMRAPISAARRFGSSRSAISSRIWRSAGCAPPGSIWSPQKRDGGQFGFSVAGGRIRGHVDGIIADAPAALGLRTPALWECKTMNAKNWRGLRQGRGDGLQARLCRPDRDLPGLHGAVGAGDFGCARALHRDQQGHGRAAPRARALRCRSGAAHVRPRGADPAGHRRGRSAAPHRRQARDFFECRFCAHAERCWGLAA